jgi:hypothetical protein
MNKQEAKDEAIMSKIADVAFGEIIKQFVSIRMVARAVSCAEAPEGKIIWEESCEKIKEITIQVAKQVGESSNREYVLRTMIRVLQDSLALLESAEPEKVGEPVQIPIIKEKKDGSSHKWN